jgi:hypothetical protein
MGQGEYLPFARVGDIDAEHSSHQRLERKIGNLLLHPDLKSVI